MKFLSSKKTKQVEALSEEVNRLNRQLYYNKKDDINDFISILEQIQETNNENLQWKKRQSIVNNEISLAIENYRQKILELDINASINI